VIIRLPNFRHWLASVGKTTVHPVRPARITYYRTGGGDPELADAQSVASEDEWGRGGSADSAVSGRGGGLHGPERVGP
jgi:hypothetical protein